MKTGEKFDVKVDIIARTVMWAYVWHFALNFTTQN